MIQAVRNLFSYDNYGCAEGWLHMFEGNVVLKVPFGNFPIGTSFPRVQFDARSFNIRFIDSMETCVPQELQYVFPMELIPRI